MTYEEIKKKIEACTDLGIVEEKETGNSKQLRLSNGAIINCLGRVHTMSRVKTSSKLRIYWMGK